MASDAPKDESDLLVTRDLTIHYGNRPAISGISIRIQPGRVVSVLGPNGAGKSTLLRALVGMQPTSHGDVLYRGKPLRGTHPEIVYVPQRSGADWTFPISVLEATALGMSRGRPRWQRRTRQETAAALAALETVGIPDLANVQIGALSGGQQQRVFLARALVSGGRVLVLDEPFAGVDVPTQETFADTFRRLRDEGVAVVYATHDLEGAMQISDEVALVNRTLVASGAPATVLTEANLRATFGGRLIVVASRAAPEPLNV